MIYFEGFLSKLKENDVVLKFSD